MWPNTSIWNFYDFQSLRYSRGHNDNRISMINYSRLLIIITLHVRANISAYRLISIPNARYKKIVKLLLILIVTINWLCTECIKNSCGLFHKTEIPSRKVSSENVNEITTTWHFYREKIEEHIIIFLILKRVTP